MFHLVVNALKFSKPRLAANEDATVTISPTLVKEKDSKTDKYELFLKTSVIDKGIGMSDGTLKNLSKAPISSNICDPGLRQTKKLGFGLGLTTARMLARAQNGRLFI